MEHDINTSAFDARAMNAFMDAHESVADKHAAIQCDWHAQQDTLYLSYPDADTALKWFAALHNKALQHKDEYARTRLLSVIRMMRVLAGLDI